MKFLGRVAVLGGGSWATALAKLLLHNEERILWYMRRADRIEDFRRSGHNPAYLSDVIFDTSRIDFSDDINEVCSLADTLVIALPSPYIKSHLAKICVDISQKNVVVATKGIIPDENILATDYFVNHYGCKHENMLVIGGPCHAEEVALQRLSYLTIGCRDLKKSEAFASLLRSEAMKTICSTDVDGIEYGAVLKNVYAIASGIINGMKNGDNFQAMLVSNAIREMQRFVDTVAPMQRNICDSAYLGDLLVTSYSRFSRNHNFGSMIGKGYSVKAAMMEMEMVAEGYYATRCIRLINERYGVDMPILDCVYAILYEDVRPHVALTGIVDRFV
jgi:glycerol-3-phosphate dehydrogenase (NAD(P)+)